MHEPNFQIQWIFCMAPKRRRDGCMIGFGSPIATDERQGKAKAKARQGMRPFAVSGSLLPPQSLQVWGSEAGPGKEDAGLSYAHSYSLS